jgi:hypothetical protein
MRRSALFVVAAAMLVGMAGPATANGVGFASSSPTGTIKGVYENLFEESCQGSDGMYAAKVRGVLGTVASTAPSISGDFEAEVFQIANKNSGDGVAVALLAGENAWSDEWFALGVFVTDLPSMRGTVIGFGEFGSTLVANAAGRWKSGAQLDLAFGGSSALPNLGVEVLGDDCGAVFFRGLSRMTAKLAPRLSGDGAAKVSRIGRQARAIAARPASAAISVASDFSIRSGSASNDGGYGTDVFDSCPGDDTSYYYAGTGFEGGLSSTFDDFNGVLAGEALQFVRADTDRGLALALMDASDGFGSDWEGFALGVVRGQKVRGVGLFLKDSVDPAAIVANMTGRFRDNDTYTLGFGAGSLALQNWTFATDGTDCAVLPT